MFEIGNKLVEISPKAGRQIIESRPAPANIYRPTKTISPREAGQSSDVVPGPASIAELARALMNDVDNIFEWVYNNVDFLPTYGLQKGALGGLVDNAGSNFDQCELLVQQFRFSTNSTAGCNSSM